MRKSSRYFPLVGWLLATILAAVYVIVHPLVGSSTAFFLLIILSLIMTGALHEDDLADTFDGFLGGYTKECKLAIMKGSLIGTYGTCALVLVLLSKFILLSALAEQGSLMVSLSIAYHRFGQWQSVYIADLIILPSSEHFTAENQVPGSYLHGMFDSPRALQ